MKNQRRKKFLATAFQKKTLILFFFASVVPAFIVGVCLYYMIFQMIADQMMFPEAIASSVIPVAKKVTVLLLTTLPLSLYIIWLFALGFSHRIAGPLYRIEKELDARISGEKTGPIQIRKNDEMQILVEKINKLLKY